MKNTVTSKLMIRRITITAAFIALAAATKMFASFTIPLLGANGLKVGISGIFNFFPAILFGPLYGGVASAISDILGVFFNPEGGAYNPIFTAVAFIGGFLKGVAWRLISGKKIASVRVITLVLLALLGVFGTVNYVSLISDGLMSSPAVTADSLPSKGAIADSELSFVSRSIVALAQYKNDTYTVLRLSCDSGEIRLPSSVTRDGVSGKVKNISANALDGIENAQLLIPSGYSGDISEEIFAYCKSHSIVIVAPEGSSAAKAALNAGLTVILDDVETICADYSAESFKTSGTHAKYLAGYMNFATLGLVAMFLLGGGVLVADMIVAKVKSKSGGFWYMQILATALIPGMIVSTINTWLLMQLYYQGQAFMVLWIPRTIEEILINLIQAYFITLLYNVYRRTVARSLPAGVEWQPRT